MSRVLGSLSFVIVLASLWGFITAAVATEDAVALNLVSAAAVQDARTGKPVLAIRLDERSATSFADFSKTNVGSKMELSVDGNVIAAPVLREPILGGVLQIDLGEKSDTAASLARQLSMPSAKIEVKVSR